ncbi:anthranilate synthase component I [Oribacterium sp. C9]|uniref:anthranilate synthase component I n=1 Tax=Oribacterium sp. C9 TaxID=1943579 RepID=UPI00098E8DF7|nr:anthranilate synthase component I [Oribacterium sp. C9]OON84826.1 anthranilate synthase component I [Oribacterium sp. C9]
MTIPGYETVKQYQNDDRYKRIPVAKEILSDFLTPIAALRILKSVSNHVFMLESVEDREKWGRYTFIGFDPKMEITCQNGELKAGGLTIKTDRPYDYIRQILSEYRMPKIPGLPSFTGGLVGYFSYDYLKYYEPSLTLDAEDTEHFNDIDLMLFDKVIAFDNLKQKIIVIVDMDLAGGESAYHNAEREIDNLIKLLRTGTPKEDQPGRFLSEVRPFFDKEHFCDMVEKAKHYIHEGDIFQIVLSNRLEADYEGTLLNAYRVLRTLNPSPYMFYFSSADLEVAGASPETLVKLEDGVLHTFPLAGTRPRGKTEEEDKRLEEELLQDEKELAEHNMLVDLGRNDIGRISKFGSVKVEKYHEIERYSHVMHIGSTVRGEIREDADALDAVGSILPAGTLSGAPKIRACQLINDLENNKRGIYGGGIGYIDFSGNLDLCIAIRIAYKKNGKVFVRSGAGIVADSVPEKEYQECINKAAAVVTALKQSEVTDL